MDNETLEAIVRLVEKSLIPQGQGNDSKPFVILHQDQKVEDIERLLAQPRRKVGTPSFSRVESFCQYVNEHKTDASRIYATSNTVFVAVLDHHGATPGWGQHKATLSLKLSPQWLLWTGADKRHMTQREFGTMIEDNLQDIGSPPSAELLDMVRQFEATSTVEFKSFQRDDRGNFSIEYAQTVQSKAGQKGEVELPKDFSLRIPAFEGGEQLTVVAKLRFDIGGGKLSLWYELQHVQRILQEHTDDVVAELEDKTEIKPFFGTP